MKKVHKILGTIVLFLSAILFIYIENYADVGLGQVEFQVRDQKGNPVKFVSVEVTDTNQKVVDLVTTNEKGKAVIKLAEGKYCYKIAVVPAYYQIDSDWMFLNVTPSSSQIRNITLKNQKSLLRFTVKDEKQDAVRGVYIEIADEKSCLISTITTDKEGYAEAELPEGSYYYKVVEAPSHLECSDDSNSVEIFTGDEKIEKITLKQKKGIFKIELTSSSKKNRVAGQLFSIYDLNDNHITKMTTDAQGRVEETLPAGKYYFKLIMAPFKSQYAKKHIEFEVIEGQETFVKLDI